MLGRKERPQEGLPRNSHVEKWDRRVEGAGKIDQEGPTLESEQRLQSELFQE